MKFNIIIYGIYLRIYLILGWKYIYNNIIITNLHIWYILIRHSKRLKFLVFFPEAVANADLNEFNIVELDSDINDSNSAYVLEAFNSA